MGIDINLEAGEKNFKRIITDILKTEDTSKIQSLLIMALAQNDFLVDVRMLKNNRDN